MFGSRQFSPTRIMRHACGKQWKSCFNTEQVSVWFHELMFNDYVPVLRIRKYFFRILMRISGVLILTFGAGSGYTLLFPIMRSFILRSFTVVYLCYESLPWDKVYFILYLQVFKDPSGKSGAALEDYGMCGREADFRADLGRNGALSPLC